VVRRLVLTMWMVCAAAVGGGAGCGHTDAPGAHADDRVFICPMRCVQPGHTEPYTQHGPGQCPVCGMNLVVKPE